MGQFDGREFSVSYDYLVVAVGAVNNTFGVPGVHEHAFFLKDLRDARKIRQRIIDNFESASTPGLDVGEIQRFLHFVVVGGGPTGVEFAAELTDLLEGELAKAYSHLVGAVRITLIEAGKQILNSYDEKISNYATKLFNRRRVEVLTNKPVKIVEEQSLQLQDGTVLNYGLLVWSTGNGQTAFVNSLNFQKDKTGKLLTDGYFRLNNSNDIFAVGDNANMNGLELPATAQVAGQSGKYLGKLLTRIAKNTKIEKLPVFKFKNLGMLAYIGGNRAVADLPAGNAGGFSTWIFWRSAYLTKLVSLKNKVLVLFDWFKAAMFGRDISRF